MEREGLLPGQGLTKAQRRRREVFRARYREARANGWCTWCGQESGQARALCPACQKRASHRRREQKRSRIASGQCPDCGGVPQPGRRRCADCLASSRKHAETRYGRLARSNSCRWCGQGLRGVDGALCESCLERRRHRRRLIEAIYGRCRVAFEAGAGWAFELFRQAEADVATRVYPGPAGHRPMQTPKEAS